MPHEMGPFQTVPPPSVVFSRLMASVASRGLLAVRAVWAALLFRESCSDTGL